MVCDPSVLKHGVRRIYALDGSLVTNLDQLDEGQAYVCASTEQFHRLDYVNITRVDWVNPSRKISTPAIVKPSESYLAQFQRPHQPTRRYGIKQRSRVCLSLSLPSYYSRQRQAERELLGSVPASASAHPPPFVCVV